MRFLQVRLSLSLALVETLLFLTLGACRTTSGADVEEQAQAKERVWYSRAGEGGECEPAPAQCPRVDVSKDFIDACVAAGHQAKTCGCEVRCSTKVTGFELQGTSTSVAEDGPGASGCPADALKDVAEAAGLRQAGGSLDRCIETLLCRGLDTSCVGPERTRTLRLRSLAQNNCEAEVLDAFCRSGHDDTLKCPDADIVALSQLLDAMTTNVELRRCVRNVTCGGGREGCQATLRRRAGEARATIGKAGCEYWGKVLCSIGG